MKLSPLALALIGGVGLLLLNAKAQASVRGDYFDPNAPGPLPGSTMNPDFNVGDLNAWAVEALEPSPQLIAWLKNKEALLLNKTDLGDGGMTIGWGHFEPTGVKADSLPASITREEADTLFAQDLESRAVDVVRKYINVPLKQNQFDALVSLAYNLSPNAFSQIAEAVNRGDGIDPVAFDFVRPGTQFEHGLRNRRVAEIAIFNDGVYA